MQSDLMSIREFAHRAGIHRNTERTRRQRGACPSYVKRPSRGRAEVFYFRAEAERFLRDSGRHG